MDTEQIEQEKKVIVLARQNGVVTVGAVHDLLGINDRQAMMLLQSMVDRGNPVFFVRRNKVKKNWRVHYFLTEDYEAGKAGEEHGCAGRKTARV